jgi:cobyrinic acid a,c-diamide synthase
VASERHFSRLAAAIEDVPVLGYLPRDLRFEVPHRHLGLVVAEEDPLSRENLDRLADAVLEYVNVDRLLDLAKVPARAPQPERPAKEIEQAHISPVRVAVALDRAFCFYYQDNLDILRSFGAEILFFSPLSDPALPEGIDAVYLGGGYPELYGTELSSNLSMRASIKEWAGRGGPIYGECGGFMYLCEGLHDFEGNRFDMTGVFPFQTAMVKGRAYLGYREVHFLEGSPFGPAGQTARGHEFHYSKISGGQDPRLKSVYKMSGGSGEDLGMEGYRIANALGSYIHLHFGSNPAVARGFTRFPSGKKAVRQADKI